MNQNLNITAWRGVELHTEVEIIGEEKL